MPIGYSLVVIALVGVSVLTFVFNLGRLATPGDRAAVALFLLACIAFGLHFVVLDRIRQFRVKGLSWSWYTGFGKDLFHPQTYAPDAHDLLRWAVRWRVAGLLLFSLYVVLRFLMLVLGIGR